jgi:DNA-binding MarR family transcriptional regulator
MAVHRGPEPESSHPVPGHKPPDPPPPDRGHAAAIDDAAQTLLVAFEVARDQVHPRVSWPQLNALLAVERSEGVNLGGLAADMRMLLSSASRLCDRLVASGLVERAPGRADRREIALYLTPLSRTLLRELRAIRRTALGGILDRMSPAGRAALLRGLTEFAAVADEAGESAARTRSA